MSFKQGRIGIGRDPIFPLDVNGSARIDGDLILAGRFSDSAGNAIQLGGGSGVSSVPEQGRQDEPSWSNATMKTTFDGNVGIGIEPTTIALNVRPSGNDNGIKVQTSTSNTYAYSAQFLGNSGRGLTVVANGAVGIGTTTHSNIEYNNLRIVGNNGNNGSYQIYATDAKYGIYVKTDNESSAYICGQFTGSTGKGLQIRSNGNAYFTGGDVGIATTDPTETLHVNGSVGAGYKNSGAHPSTITNGYNWQGSVWNDDGTVTWKAGTGGTAGGMAPRGGWDANTTYILTVESKTTAGSYTLGGTSFNPGASYSTQVKEFTGSLGEMRNNWGSNNEITFKRWDVSIKNKKMLNVNQLGGVGINDDRVFDDDFGHLYIDSTDFPTLRRGGKDYTSRSFLTVGGSMILSAVSGNSDDTTSNIYFNAPNAAFQTGLIWRRENPGSITYISGAILFDSELQHYSSGTTTGFSAGGLSFYTSNTGSGWSASSAKRRMVIHGDGKVGIGTASPWTGLHVETSHGGNYHEAYNSFLWEAGYTYDLWTTGNHRPQWSDSFSYFSIYSNRAILIRNGGIWSASDKRIKMNIEDVPDHLALEMVRNIPCRYYEYKDPTRQNGNKKTIGFIAQEVDEIFPLAVTKKEDFIPSEMRLLIENENAIWSDLSNNTYKLYITDLEDAIPNTECIFMLSDCSDNVIEEKIQVLEDGKSFIFNKKWNKVFLHSKRVSDFHVVDKQKLFALNFSATQELDRKVIALENENAELKAELAAIKQHLGI